MELDRLLPIMAVAYLLTVSIEAPILLLALSRRHTLQHRLFAGFWLTACTYPILWLVLPSIIDPGQQRIMYLAVGETFVPLAECILFWFAFGNTEPRSTKNTLQDMAAIVVANLFSFGWGEVFNALVGWDWLVGS